MTDIVERLNDDVRQLTKMVEHAKLAGPETGVRVKDPSLLLADLSEAASRISQQDAELDRLRRELAEAEKKFETADKLRVFWNDKATELAGKLAETRKDAFIEAAEIADGYDETNTLTAPKNIATALRAKAEETRT